MSFSSPKRIIKRITQYNIFWQTWLVQQKKKPTPNALPAQSIHHSSIKRIHEASRCCFNKLSVPTAEQLPSAEAPVHTRESTNASPFAGLLNPRPDHRWVEAQTDIVVNCQSVDGQTSVKNLVFFILSLFFLKNTCLCGVLTLYIINLSNKQCRQDKDFLFVTLFSCLLSHGGYCCPS